MRNKLFQNKWTIVLVILLVGLLALVRAFEDQLFYDPFLNYFKGDFHSYPLPAYESVSLFFGLFFRYIINTVLSLGILYILFKEVEMIQFAAVLYAFFFLVLIVAFFAIIHFYKGHNILMLFYVRRFLIQPIFVILFIPAFYYQNQNK